MTRVSIYTVFSIFSDESRVSIKMSFKMYVKKSLTSIKCTLYRYKEYENSVQMYRTL